MHNAAPNFLIFLNTRYQTVQMVADARLEYNKFSRDTLKFIFVIY